MDEGESIAPDNIKIIFLGTNGWYPTDTGQTTCILIETKECYLVLDAGSGICKVGRYLTENKPIFLLLSHFHLDHTFGLHILNKFGFNNGLTICCHEGGKQYLDTLVNHPYTMPIDKLSYKVRVVELCPGIHKDFPFALECRRLFHPVYCLGYRIGFEDKIIAFCTDTGVCDPLRKLAKNADILIAECSVRDGKNSTAWPHLSSVDAAKVAKEADVDILALIHFDADNFNSLSERTEAANKAKSIYTNTFAAYDEMEIII